MTPGASELELMLASQPCNTFRNLPLLVELRTIAHFAVQRTPRGNYACRRYWNAGTRYSGELDARRRIGIAAQAEAKSAAGPFLVGIVPGLSRLRVREQGVHQQCWPEAPGVIDTVVVRLLAVEQTVSERPGEVRHRI